MDQAILLTYDVRPGTDLEEYERWLREVDNPFFNSQPGIKKYVNWKVEDNKVNDTGFPYFDLFILEEGETYESIFNSPEIDRFSRNWDKLWGRDPEGGQLGNIKGATVSIVASPDGAA